MNQLLAAHQANDLLSALLQHQPIDDVCTKPYYHDLLAEAERMLSVDKAAHMTADLAPYSLLGMQLAAMHRGNLLSAELYPELRQAESYTLNWLKSCFGMPYGHFSHGGSDNNLQALWQARDSAEIDSKIVYASRARHYSVDKACRILGLKLELIATDADDRIDVSSLEQACRQAAPVAIVLTAGTSLIGALDPLQPVADIAARYQCWLHLDAAWGGALLMLPEQRESLHHLARLDSLGFDPHKSLFQPRPCSVYLSRHLPAERRQTDYLDSAPTGRVTGSYGAELFLSLWLNLKVLGEDWFYQQTRLRLQHAQRFATLLATQQVKTWNGGSGIVCFAAQGQGFDDLVVEGVLSKARILQQTVYRAVFASYQTQSTTLFRALPLSL
jgi:glutamate/tyrosine decarboxylase-like PLP-dependent enzyme